MDCPICNKSVSSDRQKTPHRPFCSAQCKTIDLAKWLDGSYAVPGEPVDSDQMGAESSSQTPKNYES